MGKKEKSFNKKKQRKKNRSTECVVLYPLGSFFKIQTINHK